MAQARNIFTLGQPQDLSGLVNVLTPILNQLADRLDRAEGLRGNPRFYASTLEFPKGGLAIGNVLRAISATRVEPGNAQLSEFLGTIDAGRITGLEEVTDLLGGRFSIYDEEDCLIHQAPIDQLAEFSEVTGFLRTDPLSIWNPAGLASSSTIPAVQELVGGLISISDEEDTIIHEFPLANLAELSEVTGFLQTDALTIWNPTVDMSKLLVDVYDEFGTVIHEFPSWQVSELCEVTGFLQASPRIWNPEGNFDALTANTAVVTTITATDVKHQGMQLSAGDFSCDANWGAGAAPSISAGYFKNSFIVTVTAAGTPGANPILTFTSPEAFGGLITPFCQNVSGSGTIKPTYIYGGGTTWNIVYQGTPVAGLTYNISVALLE